jgi:hypothetical protein
MVRGILTVDSVTRPWAAVAAVVPAVVLAVIELSMLVFAIFGDHPLWRYESLNLSEAAALRDAAEIVRLIDLGHDPNTRRTVRAGFLDGDAHEVTPLAAATHSDRSELVDLLMSKGAKLDAASWARLRCFAQHNGRHDAASALDAWRPAGATVDCSGSETVW